MIDRLGRLQRMMAATACLLLLAFASTPAMAKRVALVIGNSAYEHMGRLTNPANDAADMAARLKSLGFDVTHANNLGVDRFDEALDRFVDKADGADVALFFFAGHGQGVQNRNYLIPVDATLKRASALRREAIDVDTVVHRLGRAARMSLFFLDACRNNPAVDALRKRLTERGRTRDANAFTRGFGSMPKSGGETLVVYAAAPGTVAFDGKGRNSPFTKALIASIDAAPAMEIESLLKRVRRQVRADTEAIASQTGKQVQKPEWLSRLESDFRFREGPVARPQVPAPRNTIDADYAAAAAIGTKEAWQVFLNAHGGKTDHIKVQLAKAALKKLAARVVEPMPRHKPQKQPTVDALGLSWYVGAPEVSKLIQGIEFVWRRLFRGMAVSYKNIVHQDLETAISSGNAYCHAKRIRERVISDHSFYCDEKQTLFYQRGKSFKLDDIKLRDGGAINYSFILTFSRHIQQLVGVSQKVASIKKGATIEVGEKIQVRYNLQAHCLSGLWVGTYGTPRISQKYMRSVRVSIENGTPHTPIIIGGRTAQNQPHGSLDQRVQWFKRGLTAKSMAACDTFAN